MKRYGYHPGRVELKIGDRVRFIAEAHQRISTAVHSGEGTLLSWVPAHPFCGSAAKSWRVLWDDGECTCHDYWLEAA